MNRLCCWRSKKGKVKKPEGSQKEIIPLQCSHDEEIREDRESKVKGRKGSQNVKLLRKHSHDGEIREYPERKFEDYGDEMKGYEEKNQKYNEERRESERLKKELDESENEKAALKISHKEEMGVLRNELRDLKERMKEQEQMQRQVPSTEHKGKEDYEILKKKLEESEREIKKWTNQYNSLAQEKGTIEEEPQSLRSAEAKINELTRQLEDERKASEQALLRKSEEYMKEKSTLNQNHQMEIKNLQDEIRGLKERLKKELDESENEKAALKISHKEEMGVLRNELRDLKERIKEQEQMQCQVPSTEHKGKEDYEILKKKLEESEREIKKWKNQYNSLVQEKGTIEEEPQSLRSAEAKINELTRHLEDERKASEQALLRKSEEYMKEKSTLNQNHQVEIKNLQDEIRGLKERTKEQEQLQHQVASTKQKEKDLVKEECKKKLEESENEKVALKISHTEEIGELNEQIRKLQDRLTIDKSSYEKREKEWQTKCDELEADIASYKENWTKSEDAKIQLDIKITELEKKSKEGEREIKAWKNQYNSLEDEKRRTEEELKRIQALRIQYENERKDKDALLRQEAKINQLTNQLDNERKAKEDALLRLSSMASNKLRDNNPNIADLSDPNRPTKLSEQFSELYDNEWTDAFDELEKLLGGKEDKEIISYLRDFVLEIHSFCSDITSSKLKTIEEVFVKPSVPCEDTKIPTEIFKTIKDGIKSMAPKLLEHTKERVLGRLEEKYFMDPVAGCLQHENVKRYIDKCTEVCWYMSVQDPQLVMDGSKSPDEKFDSNKHREYTKKGPYEEFVVWPVLYLYRGGQMLSKGVAQGAKKEMSEQQ